MFTSWDDFLDKHTDLGSIESALTNNLYGLNLTGNTPYLPLSQNKRGFVFMTRPQLNLETVNLRGSRKFSNFGTNQELNIFRFMRATLDPRLALSESPITTRLVDPEQAFIPIITNSIKELSGWESPVLDTQSTKAGRMQEQYIIPDGTFDVNKRYTLDITVPNIQAGPMINLFYYWAYYIYQMKLNRMSMYPDYIIANRRDYDTRIYRIITDASGEYVTNFSMTGVGYPVSSDLGKLFDFNDETPLSNMGKTTTIRLECIGAYYNDPLIIQEFNNAVSGFNPQMRAINKGEGQGDYFLISPSEKSKYRTRCYPRINPNNHRLEWWTQKET